MFTKEQAKALQDEKQLKRLTNAEKKGIIKSITVEDITTADSKGIISDDCKAVIASTIKSQKVTAVYDEVRIINIPRDKDNLIEPLRTNAISSPGYPKVILEINEAAFTGKSKEQIDKWFKTQKYSVADSLEEAVIHECAHAKVIRNRTYSEYEAIDHDLKGSAFTEALANREDGKSLKDLAGDISKYAQEDGLECIAEAHILLHRGESVAQEIKALHDKYIS